MKAIPLLLRSLNYQAITRRHQVTTQSDLDLALVVHLVDKLSHAFHLMLKEYETRAGLGSSVFFTPPCVVKLMARLVMGEEPRRSISIYDPYVRAGEMLVGAAAHLAKESSAIPLLHGDSYDGNTLMIAGMNLMLGGFKWSVRQLRIIAG